MATYSLHLILGSALLALTSCSSTDRGPRFRLLPEHDVARDDNAPLEAPRRGHTHPDTEQHPDGERQITKVRRWRIVDDEGRLERARRHERRYRFLNEGWYIGGSYGWTDGNESAGKLQNDLNRRTPAGRNVSVALDDTDWGFKGYVGYRFHNPFALELAYTGLEGPNSAINSPVVDANLISDVGELHPVTGRGPSISLLGFPYEEGRLSTFAKLGFWYWQADVDVQLGNTTVNKDPDGLDFVVGLGAQYRLYEGLGARVEYERYFLDDDGVDMFSVGFTYNF